MSDRKYKKGDSVEFIRGPNDGRKGKVSFVTSHGYLLVDMGDGSDIYCHPSDLKPAK